MGGSGSKSKGVWPFSGSGNADDPTKDGNEQSLARVRSFPGATPFVFTRRSSLFFDEDGDLAHEFYEETILTKNGRKRATLKRIHKNLRPQGILTLDHPCIHVDFPVVLCEAWRRLRSFSDKPLCQLRPRFPKSWKPKNQLLKYSDPLIYLTPLRGQADASCAEPLHVICFWLVCSLTRCRSPSEGLERCQVGKTCSVYELFVCMLVWECAGWDMAVFGALPG